jgi:phosphate transport system substrate-binding protein
LALATAAGCGEGRRSVTQGTVRVVGSDTARRLVRAEADSFAAVYEGARIEVEGGGSLVGLEALVNRQADVAILSRAPSDAERAAAKRGGVEIALYPFALDGLCVIVNAASPVYALSHAEASAIFAGATDDWAEVGGVPGPIQVYVSGVQGGALGTLRDLLLGGREPAAAAGRAPSTEAVADSVARHEGAIGVASHAELREGVRALPLSPKEGGPLVAANVETIYKRRYPLVRTFYCATRGIPRDDLVSGFVSFMMSTRGQRIVLDAGFVPATVPLRIQHEE